jgi:hypothetical protein
MEKGDEKWKKVYQRKKEKEIFPKKEKRSTIDRLLQKSMTNTTTLSAQIDTSTFLTRAQKLYWHGRLEQMNDVQKEELQSILREGEALPPKKPNSNLITILFKAIKALKA